MGKEYYIKVNDWTKVSVTEEIYRACRRPQWKEAKRRKKRSDMECSYELLVGNCIDSECTSMQKLTEDIVMDKLLLEMLMEALNTLASDERELIDNIYFNHKTEREFAESIGLSQKGINKKKHRVLEKIRKLIIL